MKQRTVLLDADIVAYAVASRNETRWDFDGDGELAIAVDRERALEDIHEVVDEKLTGLNASKVIVCMSDPASRYFRHDIWPAYKANRKATLKPQLLSELKGVLADAYETYRRPLLEADDCQGILATNTKLQASKGLGECIIVSEDKDMRGVPAKVFNPRHAELGVLDISPLDADRFHLWQAIVGDTADGYPGCPGLGTSSVYAEEIVTAKRGELWDIVLEAYASKGFTEADALVQARLARILRSSDWDYQRHVPRLWSPVTIYGGYES